MALNDAGDWRTREALQSTAVGSLALMICVMPRLMPWILATTVLIYVAWDLVGARSLARQAFAGLMPVAVLLLPGLGVLSTLWSADRAESFMASRTAFALAGFTLFLVAAIRHQIPALSATWQSRFMRGITLGGLIGITFLVTESVTGNAITRRVLTAVPALTGSRGKGLRIDAGKVSEIAGFFANRNVAGLTLLAIPLILSAWLWLSGGRRTAALCVIGLGLLLVVFRSDSETAKLALIIAAAVITLAHRWPRPTMQGLALALAVGVLFTLSLARLPLRLGLQDARWLPESHRDRVLIWDANADIAEGHRLLGAGVEASRILQQDVVKARKASAEPSQRPAIARRPAWHAHNFYLQVRVDLGIAGSLALLVLGLASLAATSRLHPSLVPWGYGLIAATMASGISGWGLWQYWFIAGLGADVVFLALLDAVLKSRSNAG